jgi:hypothetical protein
MRNYLDHEAKGDFDSEKKFYEAGQHDVEAFYAQLASAPVN